MVVWSQEICKQPKEEVVDWPVQFEEPTNVSGSTRAGPEDASLSGKYRGYHRRANVEKRVMSIDM